MDQVLMGRKMLDGEGNQIGKITDVIVDPATLEPEWLTVKTSRFGGEHLVPVAAAEPNGDGVTVPFDKDTVKDAPPVDEHMAPSESQREALYAHYGMPTPPSGADRLHR